MILAQEFRGKSVKHVEKPYTYWSGRRLPRGCFPFGGAPSDAWQLGSPLLK